MATYVTQKYKNKILAYPLPLPPEGLFTPKQKEYIEDLNRAIEANFRNIFLALGDVQATQEQTPYVATVVEANAKGTGWYTCSIVKYLDDGTTEAQENGIVLNLVDVTKTVATAGLVAGNKITCWRISLSSKKATSYLYIGLGHYGPSIIGICSA